MASCVRISVADARLFEAPRPPHSEAVMEYREYPYIIRRRRADEPARERQRISGDLSRVQAKLKAFEARLRVEDPGVGRRYAELVRRTREVTRPLIKAAWDNNPVSEDAEMHAPPYDLLDIDQYDDRYLQSVARHLGWIPSWIRRSDDKAAS
jgi:hypothetical protein